MEREAKKMKRVLHGSKPEITQHPNIYSYITVLSSPKNNEYVDSSEGSMLRSLLE